MAKHMCHYLSHLGLHFNNWARSKNSIETLSSKLSHATHVLILIHDDCIDQFIQNNINLSQQKPILVHFSGNLISPYAYSAHPLQSFSEQLYEPEQYRKIPFIIESHNLEFDELLPAFNNPHYKINRADKNYYHAMCVMANNFTTLLWQKFFSEMQCKFKIKIEDLQPFLDQTFINIKEDLQNALTGPIVRKDTKTLLNDLKALSSDNFYSIFKTFINTFTQEAIDEKHF